MFKKKIKKTETKLKFEVTIPQMSNDLDGIRTDKDKFKKSGVASPIFGSKVKDIIVVKDVANETNFDVNKGYDAFRPNSEKKESEEDKVKKYGTKFPEFRSVNDKLITEVYGKTSKANVETIEDEEKVNQEIESFSFIINRAKEDEVDNSEEFFDLGIFQPNTLDAKEVNNVFPDFNSFDEEIKVNPSFENINEEVRVNNYNNEEEVKEVKIPLSVDPYRDYKLPPLDLFYKSNSLLTDIPQWVYDKLEAINQTLHDFAIPGEVVNFTKGPTFTRYEILLQSGVNVKKVSSIETTLQMSLGVKSIRILAPIPGKKTVGIEVPNEKAEMVRFGDIITEEFIADKKPLKIALGKNIDGEPVYTRIDSMPHGLIAGATSSGKSVCINTLLISLLIRNRPDEVKLLLVDPKTVELISYNDLPHLVTPVISDAKMASEALKWACEEMDKRYKLLSQNRSRNIDDYNEKVKKDPTLLKMPYIVIIIDELADLMMVSSSDVEDSIRRITQKARAAGINLLVATQRPTVDVVKGTIKANIPTRIAFKVFSQTDSATILDEGGAESLLGKGDMLIKESEAPIRLQGAYISDEEIDLVTDYIRNQAKPDYLFTHDDLKEKNVQGNSGNTQSNQESPQMIYECAKFCIETQLASINALTQQFSVGFNRAQKIVAALEEMEVISAKKTGNNKRDILMTIEQLNDLFDRGDLID